MPVVIYICAMSVFVAATASLNNILVDNVMFSHVQYLRDLLGYIITTAVGWVDTRDMVAYDETRGTVDWKQLHTCMSRTSEINHEAKL